MIEFLIEFGCSLYAARIWFFFFHYGRSFVGSHNRNSVQSMSSMHNEFIQLWIPIIIVHGDLSCICHDDGV